jgi:hypothetical protein
MIHPHGIQDKQDRMRLLCDVTTDPDVGWHLAMTVFPRVRTPYITSSYNTDIGSATGQVPDKPDTDMHKISDTDLKTILNNGIKQTRTQWWHASVEYPGTVWADGTMSGTNRSTQYNEFETPDNWHSNTTSVGQRFKRKWGPDGGWTGWMTAVNGTCSEAAGGWSNYYQQSCTQSWRAGCEGGPACNHKCAGNIQDRAEKLWVWAA